VAEKPLQEWPGLRKIPEKRKGQFGGNALVASGSTTVALIFIFVPHW
jgi:hypothetical protein